MTSNHLAALLLLVAALLLLVLQVLLEVFLPRNSRGLYLGESLRLLFHLRDRLPSRLLLSG